MLFYSSYLDTVYDDPADFGEMVTRTAKKLRTLRTRKRNPVLFDAIAFRGTSGAAMAYPLSIKLNVPLICVRKSTEKSHGGNIEGSSGIDVTKYIIVDDFIDSGSTIRAIIDAIKEKAGRQEIQCTGIVLYTSSLDDSEFTWGGYKIPLFGSAKRP